MNKCEQCTFSLEQEEAEVISEGTRQRMSESAKCRCTQQWREHQSLIRRTAIDGERLRGLYESGMTQVEVAQAMGITRKVVANAMLRFRIKARKAAKRNQSGEKNANWRGSNATLSKKHRRLDRMFGTPSKCEICGTTDPDKTYDWANLTGNYDDPEDFKRMCRSCHWKYDGKYRNFNGKKGGIGKRGTRPLV